MTRETAERWNKRYLEVKETEWAMSWGTLKEERTDVEFPSKYSAAAWRIEGSKNSRWEMKYVLGPRCVLRVCVINYLHLSNHPISQRAMQSFSLAVNCIFLTGMSQKKGVSIASTTSQNNQRIECNQCNPFPAKNINRCVNKFSSSLVFQSSSYSM